MLATTHQLINCQADLALRACKTALVLISLAGLLWSASLKAALAEVSEMKLTISATVQKHASLKVLAQPSSLVVTAADIARGYVDVPVPASVQVRSNTQDGYLLMFESLGEFIRQTVVKGLSNDVQINAAGGGVSQNTAGKGMRQAQLELGFRFVLSESAQQGIYPWPMRLSVTPL